MYVCQRDRDQRRLRAGGQQLRCLRQIKGDYYLRKRKEIILAIMGSSLIKKRSLAEMVLDIGNCIFIEMLEISFVNNHFIL